MKIKHYLIALLACLLAFGCSTVQKQNDNLVLDASSQAKVNESIKKLMDSQPTKLDKFKLALAVTLVRKNRMVKLKAANQDLPKFEKKQELFDWMTKQEFQDMNGKTANEIIELAEKTDPSYKIKLKKGKDALEKEEKNP